MKRRAGTILIIAGTALIIGALFLLLNNNLDDRHAADSAAQILSAVETADGQTESNSEHPQDYAGKLDIPALGLELPVLSDWSYKKMKTAPCLYSGSIEEENLVIMGHNYKSHFGSLASLSEGDEVYFTDAGGTVFKYRVEAVEVLAADADEDMTDGTFPLTLFTCTWDGKSRVTVRCQSVYRD